MANYERVLTVWRIICGAINQDCRQCAVGSWPDTRQVSNLRASDRLRSIHHLCPWRYSVFSQQFVEPARRSAVARAAALKARVLARQFLKPARLRSWAAASSELMRGRALRCRTPFGFGPPPPVGSHACRSAPAPPERGADHCPVASQTTAKTATSDGRSIIKRRLASDRASTGAPSRGIG